MTHRKNRYVPITVSLLGLLLATAIVGCSSDTKKPETAAESGVTRTREVDIVPGVAGGTIEKTATLTVKVVSMNHNSREVTLVDDAGNKGTFLVRPEAGNMETLRAGDKVTATLKQQMVVYVRSTSGGEQASKAYGDAVLTAEKTGRPGRIVAQVYDTVASVTAIDATKRTATLKFADGDTRTVNVRPDVELSRYKVGDSVVIRVTQTLSVIASAQ